MHEKSQITKRYCYTLNLVSSNRTENKTHRLLVTFHIQSSFKFVNEQKRLKETGGPWHEVEIVLSPVYEAFLWLHARGERVLYARTRSREGVPSTRRKHLAPYSRARSRVELESKWCSTRASRRNIKRFRAFELSREADDAEDRSSRERNALLRRDTSFDAPSAFVLFPLSRFIRLEMPNKRCSSLRGAIQRQFARLQTLHDRTVAYCVCCGN